MFKQRKNLSHPQLCRSSKRMMSLVFGNMLVWEEMARRKLLQGFPKTENAQDEISEIREARPELHPSLSEAIFQYSSCSLVVMV
jgi:hypothetical protein